MRAKTEYDKWCALEGEFDISRFSDEQEKAYTTGFNRAIKLMEKLLKEKQNETISEITSSRSTTESKKACTSNRH
jgi:hypothetical protein